MSIDKAKILGQYFTPELIARDIVRATKCFYDKTGLSILEPAYGEGSFLTALKKEDIEFEDFFGVELDDTLRNVSAEKVRILHSDFTETLPDKKYNLLITNPPYTRHHLLSGEQKSRMSLKIKAETGIALNGLAGLHCYFLLLADKWLQEDGVAIWLLPTEFLDVKYGKQVKEYLLNKVQLLNIHVYDTNQSSLFEEATVSSCVVVYKKGLPREEETITFTFGKKMSEPKQIQKISKRKLETTDKWLKLLEKKTEERFCKSQSISDYFYIKRGIATGYNKYFILTRTEIEEKGLPLCCFTPIIENTRNISNPIIESDNEGYPITKERLFVLNTDLSIGEIKNIYPKLYEYLLYGMQLGVKDRYLVAKRKVWYKQENRLPAPFYCSYMARQKNGKSFRFIWNKANVIASNNFLMLYPKPCLEKAINEDLLTYKDIYQQLSLLESDLFAKQARVYATGLSKLEPSELGKVELCLTI